MSTDRELLELAAKAAGIEIVTWSNTQAGGFTPISDPWKRNFWNPLTDDGDALRLAVKLGITPHQYRHGLPDACCSADALCVSALEMHGADPDAATRRAIVRAAAEIGRLL